MFKPLILALLLPHAAFACKPDLSGKFRAELNVKAPDQALFSEAVRRLINSERCKRSLPLMSESAALRKTALGHSRDMAKRKFFSHTSPTRGQKTLKDRLDRGNVRYRRAAENIAQMGVYDFQGQRFILKDPANCVFLNANTKRQIEKHSYASLAVQVMTGWMNSTGHRRNILNPELGAVGTAVAIDTSAPHCGNTLMTQNFSDG